MELNCVSSLAFRKPDEMIEDIHANEIEQKNIAVGIVSNLNMFIKCVR